MAEYSANFCEVHAPEAAAQEKAQQKARAREAGLLVEEAEGRAPEPRVTGGGG